MKEQSYIGNTDLLCFANRLQRNLLRAFKLSIEDNVTVHDMEGKLPHSADAKRFLEIDPLPVEYRGIESIPRFFKQRKAFFGHPDIMSSYTEVIQSRQGQKPFMLLCDSAGIVKGNPMNTDIKPIVLNVPYRLDTFVCKIRHS